jgi:putative ABC transport system permease protein
VPGGDRVAVVNKTLADRHLVGGSAIGRRIRLGSEEQPWLTVVGVVADVRHSSLSQAASPEVYVPMSQEPVPMMMLAARTNLQPAELTASIREAVLTIDPAQPIYHVKTMETLVGESLLPSRMSANMVSLFSVLALVLAGIGIYGVIAYGVSQQAREFGVRMALGATPRDVLTLVLKSGGAMIGAGILLGLAGGFAMSRLLSGALFGVTPGDPLTYLAAAAVLAACGVIACAAPAWKAATTRPLNALRTE